MNNTVFRVVRVLLILAVVAGLSGCIGQSKPPPAKTSSPTWVHSPNTICGLFRDFWSTILPQQDLRQRLEASETSPPNADHPSENFHCDVYSNVIGTAFLKEDHLAKITISTEEPDSEALKEANELIAQASPERQFTARGHAGWAYEGSGFPLIYEDGTKEYKDPGSGIIGWTCGERLVHIEVNARRSQMQGPEIAMAIFNEMIDGVKCDL